MLGPGLSRARPALPSRSPRWRTRNRDDRERLFPLFLVGASSLCWARAATLCEGRASGAGWDALRHRVRRCFLRRLSFFVAPLLVGCSAASRQRRSAGSVLSRTARAARFSCRGSAIAAGALRPLGAYAIVSAAVRPETWRGSSLPPRELTSTSGCGPSRLCAADALGADWIRFGGVLAAAIALTVSTRSSSQPSPRVAAD